MDAARMIACLADYPTGSCKPRHAKRKNCGACRDALTEKIADAIAAAVDKEGETITELSRERKWLVRRLYDPERKLTTRALWAKYEAARMDEVPTRQPCTTRLDGTNVFGDCYGPEFYQRVQSIDIDMMVCDPCAAIYRQSRHWRVGTECFDEQP